MMKTYKRKMKKTAPQLSDAQQIFKEIFEKKQNLVREIRKFFKKRFEKLQSFFFEKKLRRCVTLVSTFLSIFHRRQINSLFF